MTDIFFDFVANPDDTVDALTEVDSAVETFSESTAEYFSRISKEVEGIQEQSKRVTAQSQSIVPNFNQGFGQLQLLSILLRQVGVESNYLSTALRTLSIANRVASTSTSQLGASAAALRMSINGLLASIPVLGWVLLGISAAAMAVSKTMNHFKQETEAAKKASDAFNESQKNAAKTMADVNVALLEEQGKLYESQKAKIEQAAAQRSEAYIKETVAQKAALSEMNLNSEEYDKKSREIDERQTAAVVQSRDLMNVQLKNLEDKRVKDATEAADKEAAARRNAAVSMQNAIEDELTYLGLESGALVERKLLAAGASEEEAKRTGQLKDKVDAIKKSADTEKDHNKTIAELSIEYKMNTAELEDNIAAQTELNIQKKIAAGKTREQAEEEVILSERIKDQETALKLKHETEEKARRAQEDYIETAHDLTEQYLINDARLTKNIAAEKEALIVQRMRIGLTREQATAELAAEEAIRKQEEALQKLKNTAGSYISLDQMYKDIQSLAASTKVDKSLFNEEANAMGFKVPSSQGPSSHDQKTIDVLERIFSVMDNIRMLFPTVGGLS